MKWLTLSILCLITLGSFAQDFRKDFMEVYANYSTIEHYTQEVSIRSFDKKDASKAIYEDKGKIVKDKSNYYSSLAGQQTIIKGANFLHVNANEKRMTYYYKKNNRDAMMEQYKMLLDSLNPADVRYLGTNNSIKKYLMNSTDQLIAKTELSLDMKQKVIQKIVYYYSTKDEFRSSLYKTMITYKTDLKGQPSSSWFDLDKYIDLKNQKASLKTAYKEYILTQPQGEKLNWDELPK